MQSPGRKAAGSWLPRRSAWLPIPLLVALIAGIWVVGPRVTWHNPPLFWLLAYGPVLLAIGFIVLPTARAFLANGQRSVLMLGCGVWVFSLGVLGGAGAASRSLNLNWTIYNSAFLLSALCHVAGVAGASRGRIRPDQAFAWLAAAYLGGLVAVALVAWAAFTGSLPAFHIAGRGGTLLHGLVVGLTAGLFLLSAGLLWQNHRRAPSPFLAWYALGLVLIASGLAGSLFIAAGDSPLQWVTRTARALGTVYLCVAVLVQRRGGGAEAWQETGFKGLGRLSLRDLAWRCGSAALAAAGALLLRLGASIWTGPGLPPYLTFYPAVMTVALLAGFGPGLLTTFLSGLLVEYWVLEPVGQFAIASPGDRLGLMLFLIMGVFMSAVAGLYRRARAKAEAYDREVALGESRREQLFLAQVLELSSQPFAIGYPDGRLGLFNHAFQQLTGYSGEELRALDWSAQLTPPEWQDVERRNLEELHRTGQPVRYEKEYLRKDGVRVPIELLVHLARDAEGRPEYYYSFLTDITERRQLEETLKEEARRKDDFLAVLGHELRNPLAPIRNAVHLLRKAPRSPEPLYAIIERQAAQMARLVDDLLDISRISRGKVHLQLEAIDLVAAVRGVLADYQPVLEGKGLILEADLPAVPLRIEADQARMVQVVSNLLHNASKFTDPGGRIGVALGLDPSGRAFVRIKDNGLGIPPELLGSVFEPFTQGKDTIGRSESGLGLGLALVKALVALHGGEVSARSDGPGQGAEFSVLLPVPQAGADFAPPAPAAETAKNTRPRRVLIVEDLLDSAVVLQLLLQMHGHSVEIALDGRAGLDKAAGFQPEIILCDIGLPGELSGYDVARTLRAEPGGRDLHLIAMSGFGTPEDKERAVQAGFDSHLTKPIDPALLGPMIANLPTGPPAPAGTASPCP